MNFRHLALKTSDNPLEVSDNFISEEGEEEEGVDEHHAMIETRLKV